MHEHSIANYRHPHAPPERLDGHEARTRWVVGLTIAMMVGELVVGTMTGSMALTADGWHMATHAGALGMSALAYWFARTRAGAASYTFGTGKVYALAGYTSVIALALVAILMGLESVRRLFDATPVAFDQALPVAVLGLGVNLVSAWLLGDHHDHGHEGKGHEEHDHHDHAHDHDHEGHGHHGHEDHNLRAAYLHVLADALTSVLAIVALVCGRYFGLQALDPLMGLVGGAVILHWSFGLCRGAARQLLDVAPASTDLARLRAAIEEIDDVRVADLHVWEMGPGQRACIVSLVASRPRATEEYHRLIRVLVPASHLTVEVHTCPHEERAAG